ncbi:MAG: type II toxin-antitoxin system VapC family toxin [Spirochaetales bacterium]|nr:type II toxin-antitoxin system VapC family toxin [Spirochaetales bacterium]
MGIPALILDTSAAMALFLQEEEGYQIEESLKELISSNGQIIVPSLFWYEVGNTLVSALNRKRITIEELRGIEIDLAELPIVTDPLPDSAIHIRTREIAVSKKLTFYDASYVELALRLQLPLESFDKRILAALSH